MHSLRTCLSLMLIIVAGKAAAYSLFEPVPAAQMRDLSTDRPDTTESPYTVDAGHYQIEWEALSFGTDREHGVRTDVLTSSINLKAGISDNVDIQLVLEPYTRVTTKSSAGSVTDSGMNDTEIRMKINVWGNNSGDTAFALMPFVRLPTHADVFGEDGKTEGGLILPLAFKLPGEWESAVMFEVDAVRNEDNDGYIAEFVESITFSHDISGALGGFFEFVHDHRNESGVAAESYFNTGLTYAVGQNLQLDGGFNFGISDAAQDSRAFIGISWRY